MSLFLFFFLIFIHVFIVHIISSPSILCFLSSGFLSPYFLFFLFSSILDFLSSPITFFSLSFSYPFSLHFLFISFLPPDSVLSIFSLCLSSSFSPLLHLIPSFASFLAPFLSPRFLPLFSSSPFFLYSSLLLLAV